MSGERHCTYSATSYYFDGDRFLDPFPICLGTELDPVIFYASTIRGYTILDLREPDEVALSEVFGQMNATNQIQAVCEITKNVFHDETQMETFMNQRPDLVLTEHIGTVDTRLLGIKKRLGKNVMIPTIVEEIIMSDDAKFNAELEVASHTLKQLAIYMGRDTMHKDSKNSIFSTITVLRNIIDNKEDISDGIYSRHPILYCSEPEYRARIKQETEYRTMYSEWRGHVESWD